MIIATTKRDAMVLVFALDVMRKQISKNVRKNFGVAKGLKMMGTYKSIIATLENDLRIVHEEGDEKALDIEFTGEQTEMVKEFVMTFSDLLEARAKEEGTDLEKHPWYKSLQNFTYALLIAEKEEVAVV